MRVSVSGRMTNRSMLRVLSGLRAAADFIPVPIGQKTAGEHLEMNSLNFRRHIPKIKGDDGYIEHQNSFDDMYYGLASIRHSGCEIIAVYNILRALTGRHPNMAKLISAFEKNGMIFYGSLGTDPGAMKSFLIRRGFTVDETIPASGVSDYKKPGNIADGKDEAFLLTFYNDRDDLLRGLHTVAVTAISRRLFVHNAGSSGAIGPFPDIKAVLDYYEKRGAGMISIMHVSRGR